jgi:tetratricopeptide (TPR) repeat protein
MSFFSSDYERLSLEMENHFLVLGDRLSRIREQSQEISERAADISARIGGTAINGALDNLQNLQERIGLSTANLHPESVLLINISAAFGEIDHLCMPLSRKCEAAVDSVIADQHEIAHCDIDIDDVHGFNHQISQESLKLGMQVSEIDAYFQRSLIAARQKEQHRAQQSSTILEQIFSSIVPLQDKHRVSADILHHFSIRYRAIFRNIGDIIECLQFHDITRQRIQRFRISIKDIESRLAHPTTQTGSDRIDHAIAIGQIQVIQLYQAKAGLEYAARTINSSMQNLSLEIEAIIAAAHNLRGLAAQHTESFLDNIERNFSSLHLAAGNCLNTKRQFQEALSSATKQLESLSDLIKQNPGIDYCMTTAISAESNKTQISGAEQSLLGKPVKGSGNRGLNYLEIMTRISGMIQSIISNMTELNRLENDNCGGALDEMGALDRDFEAMIRQIQIADNFAGRALAKIGKLSENLLKEVSLAISTFQSPEAMLQEIDRVCVSLESSIHHAKSHISHDAAWERKIRQGPTSSNHEAAGDCNGTLSESSSAKAFDDQGVELFDNTNHEGSASKPLGDSVELF